MRTYIKYEVRRKIKDSEADLLYVTTETSYAGEARNLEHVEEIAKYDFLARREYVEDVDGRLIRKDSMKQVVVKVIEFRYKEDDASNKQ